MKQLAPPRIAPCDRGCAGSIYSSSRITRKTQLLKLNGAGVDSALLPTELAAAPGPILPEGLASFALVPKSEGSEIGRAHV